MATTVSQPVRIAALLGLAAALAIAGMFMVLGRKSSTTPAPVIISKHHHVHRLHASAGTQPTTSARTAPAPTVHPVKGGSVNQPAPHRPAAEIAALNAGLPPKLAHALGQHDVVVVELTDPQSEVDGISFAEAQAGAQLAGVGFLPLNVLSKADVGSLTQSLGQLLPDPGLLVYTRPARLAVRIDGFADKETVAQAAENAANGT